MRPGAHRAPRTALRAALRWGAIALLIAVAVVATVPSLLPYAGFRPLVISSGSMEPALMTGDAIISRVVRPADLRVGEIVTFVDATRGNILVTHRLTEVGHEAATYSFVTQGDMNTGVERWTIEDQGNVGRLALRIPNLGFVVSWLAAPGSQALMLGLAALLVIAVTIRKIWS